VVLKEFLDADERKALGNATELVYTQDDRRISGKIAMRSFALVFDKDGNITETDEDSEEKKKEIDLYRKIQSAISEVSSMR
jgi:hypothetical protein